MSSTLSSAPTPSVLLARSLPVTEKTISGAEYGSRAIEAYAKFAHGLDMAYFLDPFIAQGLDKQKGKKVLDAGCGAAPWSIYAASKGALVDAIDLQPGMILKAKEAILQAGLATKIYAFVGDATNLPYKTKPLFDHAISINVGCNLPSSVFYHHFSQLEMVLKDEGTVDIAVPDSLDVVFTDGSSTTQKVNQHIESVLSKLPDNPTREQIQDQLILLKEVVSATFYIKNKRLVLLAKGTELESGTPIWRKLAAVTIPNFYHSESEYIAATHYFGLTLIGFSRKSFHSDKERTDFNAVHNGHPKLGEEYVGNSPFVVYHVQKKKPKMFQHSCTLL